MRSDTTVEQAQARSATLEETSWAWGRVIHKKQQSVASSYKLKFVGFSTLLSSQDRVECGKGIWLHWGGHSTEKRIQEGGTTHLPSWWGEQSGWGHGTTL